MIEDLDKLIEQVKRIAERADSLPVESDACMALMYLRHIRLYLEHRSS